MKYDVMKTASFHMFGKIHQKQTEGLVRISNMVSMGSHCRFQEKCVNNICENSSGDRLWTSNSQKLKKKTSITVKKSEGFCKIIHD